MKVEKYGKIVLSAADIKFIKKNWSTMTNTQLAEALGLKITRLRNELHSMGLKRMEMEYWTREQVEYLLKNYKEIGDVEMAEIFEAVWPKNKTWTKKHIEKKRRYLELKRTETELKSIFNRNVKSGRFKVCAEKRWITIGVSPVGTIRHWKNSYNGKHFAVIKLESGYVHYYRWLWIENHGELTSEELVVPKLNEIAAGTFTIDQLEIIDRAEHARRNAEIRNNIPPELKEIIKLKNKITKTIKENENRNH